MSGRPPGSVRAAARIGFCSIVLVICACPQSAFALWLVVCEWTYTVTTYYNTSGNIIAVRQTLVGECNSYPLPDPNPPLPPGSGSGSSLTGACCHGNSFCQKQSQSFCLANDAVYHGNGSTCGSVGPVFTAEPEDRSFAVGEDVTLTCSGTGTGPVSIEWRRGSTAIGTGPSVTIESLTLSDDGAVIVCQLSDDCGQATASATLTALCEECDATCFASLAAEWAGDSAVYSLSVPSGMCTGTPIWHINSTSNPAQGAVLNSSPTSLDVCWETPGIAGVSVGGLEHTDPNCSAEGIVDVVEVLCPLYSVDGCLVTVVPATTNACLGQPVTFAASSNASGVVFNWLPGGYGGPAHTYSWPTTPGLKTITVTGTRGNCSTVGCLADSATATVHPNTTIQTPPQDQVVNVGDTAVFSVVASGLGLNYVWTKSGAVVGGNAMTVQLPNVQPEDDGAEIKVVVSSQCGGPVQATAVLRIPKVEIVSTDPPVSTLCPGCDMDIYATTDPPGGTINWGIVSNSAGAASLTPTTGSNVTLHVNTGATQGTVRVRAELDGCSGCFDELGVFVFVPPANSHEISGGFFAGRTPAERDFLRSSPAAALCGYKVRSVFDDAFDLAAEIWEAEPSCVPDPRIGNSFVHAHASCVITEKCGPVLAELATNAHEQLTENTCWNASMDFHNNAVGREVYNGVDTCVVAVLAALAEDRLRWMPPTSTSPCPTFESTRPLGVCTPTIP